MNYKKVSAVCLLLLSLCMAGAANAQTKKDNRFVGGVFGVRVGEAVKKIYASVKTPVKPAAKKRPYYTSWQTAILKAHQDMNRANGPLGASVSKAVVKARATSYEENRLSDFFSKLAATRPSVFTQSCRTSYTMLTRAARENKIFHHYKLTAIDVRDFCYMPKDVVAYFIEFFKGKAYPYQAAQYKKAILLTLKNPKDERNRTLSIVVDTESQVLFLNYNKPANLQYSPLLQGSYVPLAVR
ncbi:hypothetical protein [Candidatus Avelusimicrobium stercoris]|uniref:hypothetical protein n=1 Tax=Candidatus Avelusimicrobium stercoris TaxID=1947924 RepID=UPI003D13CE37